MHSVKVAKVLLGSVSYQRVHVHWIYNMHVLVGIDNLSYRFADIFKRLAKVFSPMGCHEYYPVFVIVNLRKCLVFELIVGTHCSFEGIYYSISCYKNNILIYIFF